MPRNPSVAPPGKPGVNFPSCQASVRQTMAFVSRFPLLDSASVHDLRATCSLPLTILSPFSPLRDPARPSHFDPPTRLHSLAIPLAPPGWFMLLPSFLMPAYPPLIPSRLL
ncbi:unnamed protein product [Closterium sp. NIES-65]|nr:unnamed protein product [Closterium sp. NIES-65]